MESTVLLRMSVGIVLIATQYGDTHICDVELAYQPSVKFCQKGNANGRTIFITSGAQKYANAKCLCEVKADPESSDIFASYMLQLETSNCGLKIIIIDVDQVFSCNKTEANLQSNSTKFYLHKTENNTADMIAAGMCLRISIDHNLNSTNATVSVACHAENAETSTVSILSPLSSETSTISSVTTSFTKERQSTDAVHSLHSPTSSKETSTLTVGNTRKAPPQIGEDESRDSEQIGIVVGVAVGGSVLLVTAIIVCVCCYRKRQQKAKYTRNYVNTASDHEVTDNVVYNMEFPEDMKHSQISLNDMNKTYNTIDNDVYHQEKELFSPVPYANLQLDDDGESYNPADFDENQQAKKTSTPLKYNNLHIRNDAGADYIVNNPNIKIETHDNSSLRPVLESDPSYDTIGCGKDTDTMKKIKSPAAEQNQTSSVTYAVVNKANSSDNTKNSGRPNQFQVGESGDTYAVVNKKSAT